jgi:hypothetical protein
VLVTAALLALALAAWTAVVGPVNGDVGAIPFRNTSIARPTLIGAGLLLCGVGPPVQLRTWMLALIVAFTIASGYEGALNRLQRPDHPLRTLRDCAVHVQRTNAGAGRGVYNAARALANHPYYYYLRSLGPWRFADEPEADELQRRLVDGGQPTLVSRENLDVVSKAMASKRGPQDDVAHASFEARVPAAGPVTGIVSADGVVVVLPGPYKTCVAAAVEAGWRALGPAQR